MYVLMDYVMLYLRIKGLGAGYSSVYGIDWEVDELCSKRYNVSFLYNTSDISVGTSKSPR
jgi:hypothetical protein